MAIECYPIESTPAGREEWLGWRRNVITASVAGALVTDHPYTTAMHLWAEQRGTEFPDKPENKRMRRGRKLERLVGEEVAEAKGWMVEPVGAFYVDTDLRLGGTPDFWVWDQRHASRGVLQAKTAGADIIAKQWDEGRVPPEWIQWQLVCEMYVTDAAFGVIAVLDPFNWDCHIIEVERNANAERALIRAVQEFWHLVDNGIEPAPDFERDTDVIKALTRQEVPGQVCDLSGNNELREMLEARAVMLESIKAYEARCQAVENELKFKMGEAELATGLDGWKVTYKTTHVKEYLVKARSNRVLRITDKRKT